MNIVKVFYTVDRKRLLNLLPGSGIVSESFKWFTSYLKNRTQCVHTNDYTTNECSINCGTPSQGGLFMYINSLCNMEMMALLLRTQIITIHCFPIIHGLWCLVKQILNN